MVAAALVGAASCNDSGSSSAKACKVIGSSGGTIASEDGVLSLSLRPSSLSEDTEICISLAERPPNGPPFVFGQAYRVTPDIELDVGLSATYRSTLPQDTSLTAIGVVRRADFDAGQGRWLSLPLTRLEPDNELVSGTDSRLSMFYALLDDGGSGMVDPTVATTETTTDPTTDPTTNPTSDPTTDATETDATETNNVDTQSDTETDPTTGSSNTEPTDSTTEAESSDSSSSSTSDTSDTGPVVDCDNLPAGPFDITELGQVFAGNSEDLAMTGSGTFIAGSGNTLVEVDGDGVATEWFAPLPGNGMLGVKVDPTGDLIAAFGFSTSNLYRFSPDASEIILDSEFGAPNGVFIDSQGLVWVTDTVGGAIGRLDPAGPTFEVVNTQNTNGANGIFFDENRNMLFWSLYGPSQLWRAPVDNGGVVGTPVMVTDLAGNSDGVVLDECGNAYVVDQAGGAGNNPCRIDRIVLDDGGDIVGAVEQIAGDGDLGNGCANAQFGFGFGNSYDESLFITGLGGFLYRLELGVAGYPITLPD